MHNVELARLFMEADEQGFLGDINDTGACNDECSTCPASPACNQMSMNGESYEHFKHLYHTEVLPIMKELMNGD